jgi:transcription elongation factor GreA
MATIILSPAAFAQAQAELELRTNKLRPEIQQDLLEASELGDLYRENNPFDVAVDKQRLNETRIQELESILHNATVQTKTAGDLVVIGTEVHLRIENTIKVIKIVDRNSPELNPLQGIISVDSPFGAALVGASNGQTIKFRDTSYLIVKIA